MVLAVNGYDEPKETIERFVEAKSLKQKILLQGGRVAREQYAVRGFPTTFFVDRKGKVVDREVGFAPSFAEAKEAKIEKLLGTSAE